MKINVLQLNFVYHSQSSSANSFSVSSFGGLTTITTLPRLSLRPLSFHCDTLSRLSLSAFSFNADPLSTFNSSSLNTK
ncbi:hypothetical protein Hanom_Chr14g01326341 [Helianthus anomalus]